MRLHIRKMPGARQNATPCRICTDGLHCLCIKCIQSGMTFHDRVLRDGQSAAARELRLDPSMVHRCFHGAVRINDRLLNACAAAWPDFDRPGTVLEWDRRRREYLERLREGRLDSAHVEVPESGPEASDAP